MKVKDLKLLLNTCDDDSEVVVALDDYCGQARFIEETSEIPYDGGCFKEYLTDDLGFVEGKDKLVVIYGGH